MIRLAAASLAVAFAATPVSTTDPVRDLQWHLTTLNVAEAHNITRGQGITVAVVDTGVNGRHPDLAGSLIPGIDLTSDPPGDGLIDRDGHGTAQAGLIAAHGRALGIAPDARIISVRVTVGIVPSGNGVARGINWAVDHGAQVISVAMDQADGSDALRQAVDRALSMNIVVVAGAGNTSNGPAIAHPAAYPGVVAVAGVDHNGNHADISVSAPQIVIAAPAVDIVSTSFLGEGQTGYRAGTGTSDATSIVAGAAALVRSKYPNLSAAEVVHRLTATADDKGPPGRDNDYGYGVVNLVKALTADVPPLQTPTQNPPGTTSTAQPPTDNTAPWGLVLAGVLLLLAAAGGFVAWRVRR